MMKLESRFTSGIVYVLDDDDGAIKVVLPMVISENVSSGFALNTDIFLVKIHVSLWTYIS